MSLIAFHSTPQQVILLSDGRVATIKDRENAAKMNKRKIWKLSRSLGMLWLGYMPKDFDLAGQLMGHSDPYKAAQEAGRKLKPHINQRMFTGPNRVRYSMYFVGFKPDLKMQMIDSERKLFTPLELHGSMGTAAHGYSQKVTDKALALLKPMPTDETGASRKFRKAVDTLEGQGYPVGGQIFSETIRPSVFAGGLNG